MNLKVGVIGAGYFGTRHAQNYARMKNVTLHAIADTNAEAAKRLARETNAQPFFQPHALLNQVDAVSITTPSQTHAAVALPYIRAGIPTLIEKPLATIMKDAARILRAAKKSGAPILVGHVERFNPAMEKLLELVRAPIFLEGRRLSRFSGRALDTDVVQDLLIHDIDLACALVGAAPSKIAAIGARVLTDKTDVASARLAFPCGAAAHLTASRVALKDKRRMHIFAEEGYFALDFQAQSLRRILTRDALSVGDGGVAQEFLERGAADGVAPLERELAHFVEVARGRVRPRIGVDEGCDALRLAERIVRAVDRSEAARRA